MKTKNKYTYYVSFAIAGGFNSATISLDKKIKTLALAKKVENEFIVKNGYDSIMILSWELIENDN